MDSKSSSRSWLGHPVTVLAAATVVLIIAMGVRNSFGIFLKPMSADLGWGREVFAFAMALQNLLWGVSQPLLGAFADRYGSGRVIAASGALYALGLALMATAGSPLTFNLSAGLYIGIALSGTGFPVLLAVVGRCVPERRRSLFLGLASAGGSSGQVLMVPMGQMLIDQQGWLGALLVFGAIALVMVPLAAALTGTAASGSADRGIAEQSLGQAIREAAGHGGFWLLTIGFFVCGFHVTFLAIHFPAFISDSGLAPGLGAIALSVVGLGNILGSLTAGYLGGKIRKKYVLSMMYLLRAIIIAVFIAVPVTEVSVLTFAFAIGLLWLGTVPLTSAMVADMFGVRYMATLFGFVFLSHQIGSFLGAWYGGRVYDTTGSYQVVWWIAIGLGVMAAAVHWPIRDTAVPRLAQAAAD